MHRLIVPSNVAAQDDPVHDALGYRFTVRAHHPDVRSHLMVLFAGLSAVGHAEVDPLELDATDARLSDRLVALMRRINIAAVGAAAGSLLLHAGAVARPDGGSAILCGQSGSGKTTLSVRLAESGLYYLTDEAVSLSPVTLRLRPFRKPAVVKAGAQQLLCHLRPQLDAAADGTWLVPPNAFDTTPTPDRPLLPRLLVFPTFTPGAGCAVEPLSEADAAYLLGKESSRLGEVQGGALPALARLARRAPAYRLVHGDADLAVRAVRSLLAAA